jgi:hypothetical protein
MVISDTFEAVLDETCERLWDTHVRYSLRRIGELEAALCAMEQELDEIIHAAPNGRPSGT